MNTRMRSTRNWYVKHRPISVWNTNIRQTSQEIDPDDMTTLDALMPSNVESRKTLADMIMEKLNAADSSLEGATAKKVRISTKDSREGSFFHAPIESILNSSLDEDGPPNPAEGLNPKVVEVYSK
jgi:essential nuclear protein 1